MHFLITAGGTREYIDPVRFISNASSGRMGYCLAGAAQRAGQKVTLISTSDMQPPVGVNFVGVDSAAEMFAAVKKFFAKCDCLIMAAAVADYRPVRQAKNKIKKTGNTLTIKLKPTVDILEWAGRHKKVKSKKAKGKRTKGQVLVGFSLEDRNSRERADKKLKEKNLDMIIANRFASIGSAETSVEIKIRGENWVKFPRANKTTIAKKIISLIMSM